MSHPSTSQFLDGLRAARLLDDARLDELRARPEAAWGDVPSLARYAQDQGWLTPYQAAELRDGRADGLAVGGYQIFDKVADGPSGVTYKALHPALRQPVTLRLLRPDWLAPADTPAEYVARVQAASLAHSPHLAGVLDAGTHDHAPFVVQEFVDGCDLYRLVNEMGAMPVGLACEYARQAALALQAAHDKGVAHGDVSPHTLLLTPVSRSTRSNGDVSIRPQPGAGIKLAELGLSPRRPPVSELSYGQSDRLGPVAFYPPERLTSGDRTLAGDLYGLGATLYYLLTSRPPQAGDTPLEVLLNLQQAEPLPVGSLRSDTPPAVGELVRRLLTRDPAARPSAAQVAEVLAPYGEPSARPAETPAGNGVLVAHETFTQPGVPTAVPVATNLDAPAAPADEEPFAEAIDEHPSADMLAQPHAPTVEPISERHLSQGHYDGQEFVSGMHEADAHGGHGEHQEAFEHSAMGADAPRAPKPRTQASAKNKVWIVIGLILHLTATTMCLGWLGVIPNPFAAKPTNPDTPSIEKKDDHTTTPAKKKRRS